MQKKILFFLSLIFLSVVGLHGIESPHYDEQAIIIDDDINLDDILRIENEIKQSQPPGLSYNDQIEMVKFALNNPSFTFDFLKNQSQNAPKKLDHYFSQNKKAYVITITSGIVLILLALGLKIVTENQNTKKS